MIIFILGLLFNFVSNISLANTCEENFSDQINAYVNQCSSIGSCAPGESFNHDVKIISSAQYGVPVLLVSCRYYSCYNGEPAGGADNLVAYCDQNANPAASKKTKSIYQPALQCGSIVQIENQVLGESVPLVGANFSMNYFTSWSQGRTGDYTLFVPIAGDVPRDNINSFDILVQDGSVTVHSTSYTNNQSNVTYSYVWNGLDSTGNPMIGTKKFKVTVTEHRPTTTIPVVSNVVLGGFRAKVLGLGGWVPSIYLFYDINSKTLYTGKGTKRVVEAQSWISGGHYVAEEDGSLVHYFDNTGRLIYTKTGLTGGTVFTFSYDTTGHLSSITEPFGRVTTFNRNSSGVFTSITAPKGQVTTVALDVNGFVSSFTNPNSESYSATYYGTQGLLHTFQKPQGQVSTFAYDANGNLERDAHSGGYFFDIIKNLNTGYTLDYSEYSKMSRQTRHFGSGDESSVSRQTHFPSGEVESFYFSPSGEGYYTENSNQKGTYDNISYFPDARFGSMSQFKSSSYHQYGSVSFGVYNSQSITLNDPNDPFSVATYSVNSQKGNLNITTTYNPSTKAFTTTTGVGRSSETTIDTYERVTSLKQGNLYATDFTYTNENLTKIKQNTREINLAYNSTSGFLSSITNPLSQVTGFTYDNAGRVTAKTLPDLRVIGYSYDANGNLTGITPPSRPVHSFGINASELPSSYAPPTLAGVSVVNTTYSYNDDRQLTQILKPTGSSIDFAYNATTGVLENITVPAGIYTYTMSTTNGFPSSIVSPNNGPITNISYSGTLPTQFTTYTSGWTQISDYTANLSSNGTMGSDVVTGASATSTINYTYDNDEVLKTAGDIVLNYNTPNGLLTSLTMGTSSTTGFTDTYTYNSYGEVETYTAKRGSTTLYTLSFGRDALGRINSKTEFMNAATNTYAYTFDSTGRLTQTDKNAVTVATYGYDSNSNRNSGTIGSQVTTASYNNQDWMTAYNTLTFTYNANGDLQSRTNTTTSTTTQYVYDVFGNLTQVTLPSGTVITYEIDGLNRRIGKKVNGVLQKRWVYRDQTRIAAELNASGGIAKRFIYASKGNVPDYMIVGTTKYRIISDHLGSVRLVVKQSDGTIAQRMNHDEFGRVTEDTNPGYLPFGFAGGLYDHQTGVVRFGARDYDPETGRWTSKDPILFNGQMTNLYGYSFNDPVNFIDPDGKNPLLVAVGLGAVVGGAASFTGTLIGGGTFSDAVGAIPGGALAGTAATVTALGAIAGGAATGAAVATGVAVDLLITVATAPDALPPGSGQDFANGINHLINPPKKSCP